MTVASTPVGTATGTPDECGDAVPRLARSFTPDQLDKAIDKAGRLAEAVVAQFVAAPSESGHAGGIIGRIGAIPTMGIPAMEVAVEFFVPPASHDLFRHELEGQLQRQSPAYSAARFRGELGPVIVRTVPTGAFHQWRIVWRTSAEAQHRQRWSGAREMIDSILVQARDGWREVAV